MIDKVKLFTNKLQWLKPIALILALVCLSFAGYILIIGSPQAELGQYLLNTCLGLAWSVLLYAFVKTFAAIPDKASKEFRFYRRWGIAIKRGYYILMFWLCIATTLMVLFASFRALRL